MEGGELGSGRHAAAVLGQPRPEHVRDEAQVFLGADRTDGVGALAECLRGTDQLGMSVAHLILAEPAAAVLVQQSAPSQPVVDDSSPSATTQRPGRERHRREASDDPRRAPRRAPHWRP